MVAIQLNDHKSVILFRMDTYSITTPNIPEVDMKNFQYYNSKYTRSSNENFHEKFLSLVEQGNILQGIRD